MTDPSAELKIDELTTAAALAIENMIGQDHAKAMAQELVLNFINITPPIPIPPAQRTVEMDEGGTHALSTKPGNMRFDIGKLAVTFAEVITISAGVVAAPWTALFAGLVIWARFRGASQIALSEKEASVLWAMWKYRDQHSYVAEDGLLVRINTERTIFGGGLLSVNDYEQAIDRLLKIGAIDRAPDPEKWWLREWIAVNYR